MLEAKHKKIFEIYSKIMHVRYLEGTFDKKEKVVKKKLVVTDTLVDRLAKAIGDGDFTADYRKAIYAMFEVHLGKKIPRKLEPTLLNGMFYKLPTSEAHGYIPGTLWVADGNPNSHSYTKGLVVMCTGDDRGLQLRDGGFYFGNHMPDRTEKRSTVRVATKAEITVFVAKFDELVSNDSKVRIDGDTTHGLELMESVARSVVK